MSKVVVDADLRTKLNGLNEPVEFCDPAGQTVGRFVPEDAYRAMLHAWLSSQVPDEDLAKLRNQPGGRALQDIWRDLGRK